MFKETPLLINLIENKVTIHFFHRNIAYLFFVLMIIWYYKAGKVQGSHLFTATKFIPLLITLLQVLLGILSVLTSPQIIPNHWGTFEWMAQLHQLTGMCLLLSLVWVLYLVRRK